jgi:hypothetical protein
MKTITIMDMTVKPGAERAAGAGEILLLRPAGPPRTLKGS